MAPGDRRLCAMCGVLLAGKARRWCSKTCSDRWRTTVPSVPFTCDVCSSTVLIPVKERSVRKHCTRACATAHYNRTHLIGPNNPRWKGGRALAYGPNWRVIKARLRARDRVCKKCGKTPEANGRALDVHHIEPFRFSGDHSDENLVALCRSCHMRADDHGRAGSARFLSVPRVKLPSRKEIRLLEQRARALRTEERRAADKLRAFALGAEGRSLREIAGELGVSHQTVANWLDGVHEPAASYEVA